MKFYRITIPEKISPKGRKRKRLYGHLVFADDGITGTTMNRAYLEETNPLLLNLLSLTGKLHTYPADLNKQTEDRYHVIIKQMAAAEGVTEDLKQRSQWEWIKVMNSIDNRPFAEYMLKDAKTFTVLYNLNIPFRLITGEDRIPEFIALSPYPIGKLIP